LSSPQKLSHLVLKTFNVEAMRSFYCDLLGAHVVFESLPAVSFITYDEEHHRLGFVGLPGDPAAAPPTMPGLAHMAFGYPDIRALLKTYEGLRDKGIRPVVTINHGPTISLYYADPDKNNIEFYIDRMPLPDALVFMDSPQFQKNYMGVEFDADDLVAKMHAGCSDEELLHYDDTAEPDLHEMGARHMQLMHMS
jgi:catechol-2,3-dioxygenase